MGKNGIIYVENQKISNNGICPEVSNLNIEMIAMRVEHERIVEELRQQIATLSNELHVAKSMEQLERLGAAQQQADCSHDLENSKRLLNECKATRFGVEKTFVAMQEAKCQEKLMAAKVTH